MVFCILAGNFDPLIFIGVMPWNLENIRKSTNNLSFLICQFFINEITASDADPDIIWSHLFLFEINEHQCFENPKTLISMKILQSLSFGEFLSSWKRGGWICCYANSS